MVAFNPPPPPSGPLSVFLTGFIEATRRALLPLISKDEAVHRVLLLSPSLKVYSITVDDAGVITATLNDGKSRL